MSRTRDPRPPIEMQPPANASLEEPAEKSSPLHADTPLPPASDNTGSLVLDPQPAMPQQPAPERFKCCHSCSEKCSACLQRCPCSQDCVALYFGAAPASAQNNICLACGNCLTCGLCMALAGVVDCNSKFQRSDLCCAGWAQFLTAFLGVGVVFAFLEGIAIMREDGVW